MISADIKLYLSAVKVQVEAVTLENYRQRLDKFATFAGRRPVNKPLVLEYRRFLLVNKLRRSSIAMHLSTLRTFYRWLSENGHITQNPVPKIRGEEFEAVTRKEGILEHEYDRILAKADGFWKYGARMGWATGMRLADVALLKPASIDTASCVINVTPRKTRKTGKTIEIPISVGMATYLAGMCTGEYVCPEMAQHYLYDGHHTLSAQFCALARSVGVPKGFHKFKDAFISRLISQGVNPAIVAEMTGISLERVMTYLKTPMDVKRAAMNKIINLHAA